MVVLVLPCRCHESRHRKKKTRGHSWEKSCGRDVARCTVRSNSPPPPPPPPPPSPFSPPHTNSLFSPRTTSNHRRASPERTQKNISYMKQRGGGQPHRDPQTLSPRNMPRLGRKHGPYYTNKLATLAYTLTQTGLLVHVQHAGSPPPPLLRQSGFCATELLASLARMAPTTPAPDPMVASHKRARRVTQKEVGGDGNGGKRSRGRGLKLPRHGEGEDQKLPKVSAL